MLHCIVAKPTIELVYANLAHMTHKLKQPTKALFYLARAEKLATRNNNYDLLGIIHSSRG